MIPVVKPYHLSIKETHTTPRKFFEELKAEFPFTLDAAADKRNALCPLFFTEKDNCLTLPWHAYSKCVWLNPPYRRDERACLASCRKQKCKRRGWCAIMGRPGTGYFVKKAYEESLLGVTTVCLLPSRTGTWWWHELVEPIRLSTPTDVRFIRGRLHFGEADAGAPFDSVIVIFRGVGG